MSLHSRRRDGIAKSDWQEKVLFCYYLQPFLLNQKNSLLKSWSVGKIPNTFPNILQHSASSNGFWKDESSLSLDMICGILENLKLHVIVQKTNQNKDLIFKLKLRLLPIWTKPKIKFLFLCWIRDISNFKSARISWFFKKSRNSSWFEIWNMKVVIWKSGHRVEDPQS